MMLPRVLLQHHRQDMLHPEEHADHVDVEHAAEHLERIIGNRPDVALDAGIVVEHIDGAEAVECSADITGDLVLFPDIGGDGQCFGGGRQIPGCDIEVVGATIDRDNPCARSASRRMAARPIIPAAPVTTATRPSKRIRSVIGFPPV